MNIADNAPPARTLRESQGRDYVLVVDDEPAVRRFAARALKEEGYAVHEARDGVEALDLIRAQGDFMDVVVSDIVMPRLTGVELLQTLAADNPEIPVILMSGYGTAQLAEQGIASPCGVLAKPFPPERLLEEVRRCIRPRG